jgi:hypothetical protein
MSVVSIASDACVRIILSRKHEVCPQSSLTYNVSEWMLE